jgi:outer membrane protein assembly factor BamE (lipoprotein component of BamABCDE complex)
MKNRFLVLALTIAFVSGEAAYADGVNYGVAFTLVTEKEAESFAIVGKDQNEILKKFGQPNSTDTSGGVETWTYLTDPHLTIKATNVFYAGFEVFFKSKKVTYLGIIRGRNSN